MVLPFMIKLIDKQTGQETFYDVKGVRNDNVFYFTIYFADGSKTYSTERYEYEEVVL